MKNLLFLVLSIFCINLLGATNIVDFKELIKSDKTYVKEQVLFKTEVLDVKVQNESLDIKPVERVRIDSIYKLNPLSQVDQTFKHNSDYLNYNIIKYNRVKGKGSHSIYI